MKYTQPYFTLQNIISELKQKNGQDDFAIVSTIQQIAAKATELILEEIPHHHCEHIRMAREKCLALLQKSMLQADLYQQNCVPGNGKAPRYHVADTLTPALDAVQMFSRIAFI